jgi:hypothetical protein
MTRPRRIRSNTRTGSANDPVDELLDGDTVASC